MSRFNAEKIRIALVLVLMLFMFGVIMARMLQLSLFSTELYKIQSSMSSETKKLTSELAGKINEFKTRKEAVDQSLRALEQKLLTSEKDELLKDIDNLKMQHQELMAEIQNMQERVTNLSALEERTITRILGAYERTAKKQNRFDFIINFILGVVSSIVASMIYNLAAEYKLVPKIKLKDILRKLPMINKLSKNVHVS